MRRNLPSCLLKKSRRHDTISLNKRLLATPKEEFVVIKGDTGDEIVE